MSTFAHFEDAGSLTVASAIYQGVVWWDKRPGACTDGKPPGSQWPLSTSTVIVDAYEHLSLRTLNRCHSRVCSNASLEINLIIHHVTHHAHECTPGKLNTLQNDISGRRSRLKHLPKCSIAKSSNNCRHSIHVHLSLARLLILRISSVLLRYSSK